MSEQDKWFITGALLCVLAAGLTWPTTYLYCEVVHGWMQFPFLMTALFVYGVFGTLIYVSISNARRR